MWINNNALEISSTMDSQLVMENGKGRRQALFLWFCTRSTEKNKKHHL